MPKPVRIAAAVLAGLSVWTVVATLGNLALRATIPDYPTQELTMAYSLLAQFARLGLGLFSTVAATLAVVVLSRGSIGAALATGLVLLALFVPVHVSLWAKVPVWYHLFFLASLPLGAWATGKLAAPKRGAA